MWLSKFPSHSILVSLIPVSPVALAYGSDQLTTTPFFLQTILGVGIATYGDYYFTAYGLFLTVLGTFLSALKGVITNLIQVDELKLHPMDLLMRMAPLACVQTLVASWWTGELENMRTWTWEPWKGWVLVGNGILAFSMNLVSFTANKKTSALTMGVAGKWAERQYASRSDCFEILSACLNSVLGNVKQVLSIILAVLVFSLHITPLNGLGIILTLFGGAYYTIVDLQLRQPQSRLPKHLRTNPRHEDVKFAESEKDGLMSERGQGVEVLVR